MYRNWVFDSGDTPSWRRNKAFGWSLKLQWRHEEQTLKCMCFGYNFPCGAHVVISVSCGLHDSRGSEPPSCMRNCHQLHFLRGLRYIHTQSAQRWRWKLQCWDYLERDINDQTQWRGFRIFMSAFADQSWLWLKTHKLFNIKKLNVLWVWIIFNYA